LTPRITKSLPFASRSLPFETWKPVAAAAAGLVTTGNTAAAIATAAILAQILTMSRPHGCRR
jgi:hypothetical protein